MHIAAPHIQTARRNPTSHALAALILASSQPASAVYTAEYDPCEAMVKEIPLTAWLGFSASLLLHMSLQTFDEG